MLVQGADLKLDACLSLNELNGFGMDKKNVNSFYIYNLFIKINLVVKKKKKI